MCHRKKDLTELDKREYFDYDDDQKLGYKLMGVGIALIVAGCMFTSAPMRRMSGSTFPWTTTMEIDDILRSGRFRRGFRGEYWDRYWGRPAFRYVLLNYDSKYPSYRYRRGYYRPYYRDLEFRFGF